ncbi:MAG: hypothetical protein FWH29_00180 [Methanobrevibacter sp.]|nr:hypothetical protein [Methanobrevibacter sp.]
MKNEVKYWLFLAVSIVILSISVLSFFSILEDVYLGYAFASIISSLALFLNFKKENFTIPASNVFIVILVISLFIVFLASITS